MPIAIVAILLDITLIYHAAKTGRLQPWAFIILMAPLIGSLAYIAAVIVPELLGGPAARQARRNVANRLDPEKQYRLLSDHLAVADTIANREALAAECLRIGRIVEAEGHFRHILSLPMGDEPAYALGLACAEFLLDRPADTVATLDDLRARWPNFESAEGHLLYARALAACGRTEDALEEFASVAQYLPGAEARVCYGEYLDLLGRSAEAKVVFAELLVQMKRAPKYVRQAQAEWLSIAEKKLAT
jgi:hypothetical protein